MRISKFFLSIFIIILVGCVTPVKKTDLSDISNIRKCTALAYSYKNLGRNLELDSKLVGELKKQEANLNCSNYSKSQLLSEANINSILSRLNYDIYFGKSKENIKSKFLETATSCIIKVDEEYSNLSKKIPELKSFYFNKPSSINKSENIEIKNNLDFKKGNQFIDNLNTDLQILTNNRNVDINSNHSIVDLEIMRCIAAEGYCAYNDGILQYSHSKQIGRIWDGKNFVTKANNTCVPDYCNPSNDDIITDVYPSLQSVIKLCSIK